MSEANLWHRDGAAIVFVYPEHKQTDYADVADDIDSVVHDQQDPREAKVEWRQGRLAVLISAQPFPANNERAMQQLHGELLGLFLKAVACKRAAKEA